MLVSSRAQLPDAAALAPSLALEINIEPVGCNQTPWAIVSKHGLLSEQQGSQHRFRIEPISQGGNWNSPE